MNDIAESPRNGCKLTTNRTMLERATTTILDLLDPVVEPRSMTDAITLLSDIDRAVATVRLWPEFSGLTVEDLLSVEDEVLRRIHQRAPLFRCSRISWTSVADDDFGSP
ncbi:hypothetical protein QM467_10965 [Rhodoblastus sp. 17X3]|uniref:hypothetical protein n=1 Tax=Rhodoblastus sp. 17X3 TaxID=3047026 RepID=UPI0024B7E013|nr:hypothetical protein [Rhodoblastus sp. 17X3]MDI9848575.1 hypothetical protein [Rhodoblastus sp. 17X3]